MQIATAIRPAGRPSSPRSESSFVIAAVLDSASM